MDIVKTYDFWERSLKGAKPQMRDGEVHLGYYKFKTKDHANGGDPVAFWMEGDTFVCQIGERIVEDHTNIFNSKAENKVRYTPADLMNWICRNAVSYEDYSARMDTGTWPGQHEAVTKQLEAEKTAKEEIAGIGHNSGPMDVFDELRDQIDALSGEVKKTIQAGAAKTKEDADKAADLADRLGKLWGKADKAREVEKAPYWEKCCQIQDKWKPLLTAAEPYKDVKKAVITPFLQAEERKRQEQIAKERAEAEAKKRAADEAVREAQRVADEALQNGGELSQEDKTALEEAERLKQEAADAEKQADTTAKTTVKVGTRGRQTSLRTAAEPVLVDRRLASAALKDEPGFLAEIDAILVKYAKLVIASGRPVPAGFQIEQKQNAA